MFNNDFFVDLFSPSFFCPNPEEVIMVEVTDLMVKVFDFLREGVDGDEQF